MNATLPHGGSLAARETRLLRVRRIRKRVAAAAVALFVAVFLLITVLLISGHDPAIGRTRTAVVARSAGTSARTGGSTSSSSAGGSTSSSGSSGSSASSGSGLSSVTSSQS